LRCRRRWCWWLLCAWEHRRPAGAETRLLRLRRWGDARGLSARGHLHASHLELAHADADRITDPQHRWPVDPLVIDKRPVCRSQILHDQLPARRAIEARVSPRKLRIAAQRRGALLGATDHQLLIDVQPMPRGWTVHHIEPNFPRHGPMLHRLTQSVGNFVGR
jgi:hypothetical protein